jgi:hypothetical protein
MPPLPPTSGAKRHALGLGSVPLAKADLQAIRRRRAAHALVSILPYGSAAFITRDPDHVIVARPISETVSRMVDALAAHGCTSLDGAFSAYGRLKQWVRRHHPDATEIVASHVTDFHRDIGSGISILQKFDWLRDHCAAMPARYAHKAKVRKCIDRLCEIELGLRSARSRAAQGASIPYLDGWDLFQPPAAYPTSPALAGL